MCNLREAIEVFESRKVEYNRWYQSQSVVSLKMILERTELFLKCDFAIEELKKAQTER